MWSTLGWLALVLLIYVGGWFRVAYVLRDNSVADIAWGGGFVLLAVISMAWGVGPLPRPLLATALVTVWGLRLAIHVAVRNHGRGEDFRYARWRQQWGRRWVLRSFLQVFLLQGAILYAVASSILLINLRSGPGLGPLDLAGAAMWALGFVFEAVGDWQLLRFQRDPRRGPVLDRGLWRVSRHPNYFGEAVQWWGLWVIALSVPWGWTTLVSPLLITFLLLKVSGVPMLEEEMMKRPAYRDYAERTSVFVPLPPTRPVRRKE